MFHFADSGNWLYIVFGIIYVLYQLFTAGKKKDKKLPPQPQREEDFEEEYEEPQTQKNPMQDFLDKLKEMEKAQNPPSQPKVETMKAEQMKAESMKVETMKVKSMKVEPIREIANENRVKYKSLKLDKKIELDDSNQYEEELLIGGVNARDAIVASEILNRPEF